MKRVSAFIDGFNLYHAINDNKCKWLDYCELIGLFKPKDSVINNIYYFTSLAEWRKDKNKMNRHQLYIRALESLGLKTIYGSFRADNKTCDHCGHPRCTHTEKKTDVNIALTAYEHACLDLYDCAILLTGDSDQVPTIEFIKRRFKSKEITLLTPPGCHTKELIKIADFHYKITDTMLSNFRLPDPVITKRGKVIHCPNEWK